VPQIDQPKKSICPQILNDLFIVDFE